MFRAGGMHGPGGREPTKIIIIMKHFSGRKGNPITLFIHLILDV
jgi:hypothetical protein